MRRSIPFIAALFATALLFAADPPSYRGRTAEQWGKDLAHPNSGVRVAAAKALVALKADAHPAVDSLLAALTDRNDDVRLYSAFGLGQIAQRPRSSLEALTKLLADEDEHVRYSAEWSLARIAMAVAQTDPAKLDAQRVDELLAAAETALTQRVQRAEHLRQLTQARGQFKSAWEKSLPASTPEQPKLVGKPDVRTPESVAARPAKPSVPPLPKELSSDDRLIQLKAVESLVQARRADLLLRACEEVDEGGFLYWHLSRALVRLDEAAVPELTKALRHKDEGIRYQAAQCLRQIGPHAAGALPQLVSLIEDQAVSDDMRTAAILVLERLGPRAHDAVPTLTRLLESRDQDAILAASAQALAAVGPDGQEAVPSLLAIAQTTDLWGDTRIAAARAAANIAPDSSTVLQTILALLDEPDEFLVAGLSDAIGEIGPTAAAAVPQLVQLLESSSDEQRQTVVQAIGKIGPPAQAAVPKLVDRLTDSDEFEFVQVAAALAIADIGPEAVRSLAVQLDHPELVVRRTVARAYVEIGVRAAPSTADLLRKFQQPEEDEDVRALAAVALGQIGVAADLATPSLAAAVAADELPDYLRAMSAIAVSRIDPAMSAPLIAALDDSSPRLKVAAAYALQQMPAAHAAALPTLLRALEDTQTQQLAVRALVDLGDVNLPQLTGLVTDPARDVDTRLACLQVLSQFGDAAAGELVKALNDQDLAESAYWSLRDMGNDAIPHLLRADDEPNLSDDARTAIRELVEEFHDGIGGDAGETAWSGGHALVDGPQHRKRAGASAARELPPLETPGAPPIFPEFDPESIPDPEPAEESPFEEAEAADPPPREPEGSDEVDPDSTTLPSLPGPETSSDFKPTPIDPPAFHSDPDPVTRSVEAIEDREPGETPAVEPPAATAAAPTVGANSVKVFYGTNRKPIDAAQVTRPNLMRYLWLPGAAALIGFIIYLVRHRRSTLGKAATGTTGVILICVLGFNVPRTSLLVNLTPADEAVGYGAQYSDRVELGFCEVSIPDLHQEGELESPKLVLLEFKADPLKHIVLQRTQPLDRDAFYDDLDRELQRQGRSILVFVHGYNVSFENAARRTAQISYDLKFAGAPMFYSWPSQANWRKYRADEKNVELSIDQLKAFLVDVAHQSRADTINLIAHSMGNRALTRALKEIEVSALQEERLFNQVILAAPDIDADVFKQRIAPAIVDKARHITLYASSNDLALAASQEFHSGDPRAGDAGQGLVVVPGIETIDVSAGDSSLLGHSYFGSSASVLRDIEFLLRDQPAAARQFLKQEHHEGARYWRFQPITTARRSLGVRRF